MTKPIYILGISCYYHDSAAVLLKNGAIMFAAQEERYTRRKHDDAFPAQAIAHALDFAGITANDLAAAVFYEKPFLKFFERILETQLKTWPRGFLLFLRAMQEWMTKKLWTPQNIRRALKCDVPVLFTSHHESHAASAFFYSGFAEAAVVTVDGVGEWATTTICHGKGKDLHMLQEIIFPHSLGLLYSAITYYLGFKVNSAEYKVMGLAPYGNPTYVDKIRKLIEQRPDGSYALNMEYFTFEYGLTMTGKRVERLFGEVRRRPESPITQFHKDIACSLQRVTEEVLMGIVRHAKDLTGSKRLCLAGGVALNCVANGVVLRSGLFDEVFVQPAAGDARGALGAAIAVWHRKFNGERQPKLTHVFLGDSYADDSIERLLQSQGLPYERLSEETIIERTAALLDGENVVGWFQGRMEYGPRSLGSRSILADARRAENWQKVNRKIKFRESFRPFAPTVLEERVQDYFLFDAESPYMLFTADVRPDRRKEIPAVTHVDGSARLQTIRREQHPKYYALLKAFERRTGCGVIINTSFNIRGEPIVESPADAVRCFLNTDMDYLVLGTCLLKKQGMPPGKSRSRKEYLASFASD